MRVLISGLIGAAASAAVWFYLEFATKHEMGWLAIAVGLVTGLCVNAAAGPSARESTGRAALAAILALTAIVGGRVVYAKVMQNINQVKNVANVAAVVVEAEDAEGDEVAVGEVVAEEEPVAIPAAGPTKAMRLEKPTKDTVSNIDFVYMGVAALAAYVTGKGRNKVEPVDVDATAPNTDSAGDATTA
ncbi:hypothetical protein Pla144_44190 [Bythopirellula polymerisocia]|uniref:Transmembrane protein n=2 Tax=Bythopirellula polymerisocia TaxID=2528003 RepID=A0A5C6CCV2_9BACT|nr:hypothetical protein Pla144_44190 [Bythopirellula polymerisocia]